VTASLLSYLACSRCDRHFDPDRLHNLCECGSPLLAKYRLAALGGSSWWQVVAARQPSLWRYRKLRRIQVRVEGGAHIMTRWSSLSRSCR
jgi:threonine synthase